MGMGTAAIGASFLLLLAAETQLLRRARWRPYFALGLPLGRRLAPLPEIPTGSGQTLTVRWERVGEEALFWSPPGERRAPIGLHGRVRFRAGLRGLELDLRWAPPLSPLLALAWLGGFGITQGDGPLTLSLATGLSLLLIWSYLRFARRAADDLRAAWVARRGGPPSKPEHRPAPMGDAGPTG